MGHDPRPTSRRLKAPPPPRPSTAPNDAATIHTPLTAWRSNLTRIDQPQPADRIRTSPGFRLRPREKCGLEAVREYLFRTVGQITLNYRHGPLSAGAAGKVQGGDRLPWVSGEGGDNFQALTASSWQTHVYGDARTELSAWCAAHEVPLTVFPWRVEHEAAGLARDAAYLLRPDTYVALADPSGSSDALDRYCAERGLSLGAPVVVTAGG
jgi:hypothetical protein